jgi:hypothetical protein
VQVCPLISLIYLRNLRPNLLTWIKSIL